MDNTDVEGDHGNFLPVTGRNDQGDALKRTVQLPNDESSVDLLLRAERDRRFETVLERSKLVSCFLPKSTVKQVGVPII